ncbi:hypothetical protein B0O99DRAFT_695771 [Bisporella sp. PMI_857]|nr:hypothetical protein B0O99DRAFT_695771 [Bisporella sp. PMI_857]
MTVNQSRRSYVIEKPISKYEKNFSKVITEKISNEQKKDYSAAYSYTLPLISSKSVSHPLKATNSSDSIGKNAIYPQALATFNKATENSQIIARALSLTEAKQPETAAPAIGGRASDDQAISATSLTQKIKLQKTPLLDSTPATPAQQIGKGFQSPLSD